MGTVAEGLVVAQSAAAKANGGASGEVIRIAFGVNNLEVAFDADGSVIENRNFG